MEEVESEQERKNQPSSNKARKQYHPPEAPKYASYSDEQHGRTDTSKVMPNQKTHSLPNENRAPLPRAMF